MKKVVSRAQHSAVVENLSHDGRGVARIDGKTTFITGALPAEEVIFHYTQRKRSFDSGVADSIVTPAPNRVEPRCVHYDVCGGCSLQHLEHSGQIDYKQNMLMELFVKYAQIKPETILPPLDADIWHYRNKARLSVRYVSKKGGALVGFREREHGRFIADIKSCLILNKQVGTVLEELRDLVGSFSDPSSIAQIELAAGDAEIGLIFRNLAPLSADDSKILQDFAKKYAFKIYLQPAGPDSVYLMYPEDASEYLRYSLPDFGLNFAFKPTDFTQINTPVNRQMVAQAMDLLDLKSDDIVLDLFCGLGNFSLPIAKSCAKVFGIEVSTEMVQRAEMNMRNNDLDNAQFIACDLDKDFSTMPKELRLANKLLIDPPRSGAFEVVKDLHNYAIEKIVYISCNPVTLARDADILVNQHGYRLQAAGIMDMFPHTAHVESMAVFVKD